MTESLQHENIVKLLGYGFFGHTHFLAYEFAAMGSLHDILHGIKWFRLVTLLLVETMYFLIQWLVKKIFFHVWYSFIRNKIFSTLQAIRYNIYQKDCLMIHTERP